MDILTKTKTARSDWSYPPLDRLAIDRQKSWLSDLIPQDPEARSLIVGCAVAGYYAVSAWSQVLVWPASQAPYYKYGWQTCIALWILIIGMTCTLRYIDVKNLRPRREAAAQEIQAEAADEHDPASRPRTTDTSLQKDPAIKGIDEVAVVVKSV